jgi:hypothetical protein
MLASFDEAEDAVQETFLHAWRSCDGFDGSSLFRAALVRPVGSVRLFFRDFKPLVCCCLLVPSRPYVVLLQRPGLATREMHGLPPTG